MNDTISLDAGLIFIIFIIFIILKLTNVITWSWWWITSPLWLPIAIGLGILFLAGLAVLLAIIFVAIFEKKL